MSTVTQTSVYQDKDGNLRYLETGDLVPTDKAGRFVGDAPNSAGGTSAAAGGLTGFGGSLTYSLANQAVLHADGQVRFLDFSAGPGGGRTFHLDLNPPHFNADIGPLAEYNHAPVSPNALVYGSEAFLKSVSRITLIGGLAIDAVRINTAAPSELGAAYGGAAGGWGGAFTGAAIGTALLGPGPGTILGGIIGGIGGGFAGSFAGNQIQNGFAPLPSMPRRDIGGGI